MIDIFLLLWQAAPVKPGKQLQIPLLRSHVPALEHSTFWCAWSVAYALSAHAGPRGHWPKV